METVVDRLARHVLQLAQSKRNKRVLIGVYGIPGSGKSTLAAAVVHALNNTATKEPEFALLIGMDGWHYTRTHLETMPDPAEARRRRGAAFTFDSHSFVSFLRQLSTSSLSAEMCAPSFAHETKDPVEDAIRIASEHRIVIIEGIYLNMGEEPWREGAAYFDETWLIKIDEKIARDRVVKRHVQTGVTADEESAIERGESASVVRFESSHLTLDNSKADGSDMPNGRYMLERDLKPTRVIQSRQDNSWFLQD